MEDEYKIFLNLNKLRWQQFKKMCPPLPPFSRFWRVRCRLKHSLIFNSSSIKWQFFITQSQSAHRPWVYSLKQTLRFWFYYVQFIINLNKIETIWQNPHKHLAQKVVNKYTQICIIKTVRNEWIIEHQRQKQTVCETIGVFTSDHS